MTILDYTRKWAVKTPDRPAIISEDKVISYSELHQGMMNGDNLPVPLLAEAWDKDFCLYTTGTTGKPKGVIVSQKAVMANSENLIAGQGFSQKLVFIIAGDMTHLGCWSKIFPTLIQGGTLLILKDGMKNIEAFFHAMDLDLRSYNLSFDTKFATFLVPSNIRILLQFSGERLKEYADKIDFIETGAAPMPRADMLRLCELVPHTRLFNTYASTETGIVATYNYNDGRCLAGCLGHPLPHSEIFITEEGRIACKGDTLMSGYKDEPELTCEILQDNILLTADNGYLDEEGMLHIQGRVDDMINVGGYKVSPVEIEDIAMAMPSIKDCVCIAVPHPILGQTVKLLYVLNSNRSLTKREIALYINARLERYKVPTLYEEVVEVKRNKNGKIDRKAYLMN